MTQLKEDVSSLEHLEFNMENTEPCESIDHINNDNMHYHEGFGEWYATMVCPDCHWSSVKLYCDLFVQTLKKDVRVSCCNCRLSNKSSQYFTAFIRKSEINGNNK